MARMRRSRRITSNTGAKQDIIRRYTWQQALDLAAQERHNDGLECSSRNGAESFTGTASFDDAMQLALTGWHDGLERFQDKLSVLGANFAADIELQRIKYQVSGRKLDMARHLAGRPDCFMRRYSVQESSSAGKLITLAVSAGFSHKIGHAEIMTRGAAICLLSQCLESAGYAVEIVLVKTQGGEDYESTYSVAIPLKHSDHYAEYDRIAFALAHPSMLRRIIFGIEETESASIRRLFGFHSGGGYGSPLNTESSVYSNGEKTVYAGALQYSGESFGRNDNEALQWVRTQLEACGVNLG